MVSETYTGTWDRWRDGSSRLKRGDGRGGGVNANGQARGLDAMDTTSSPVPEEGEAESHGVLIATYHPNAGAPSTPPTSMSPTGGTVLP